jgi:hypothetical protein
MTSIIGEHNANHPSQPLRLLIITQHGHYSPMLTAVDEFDEERLAPQPSPKAFNVRAKGEPGAVVSLDSNEGGNLLTLERDAVGSETVVAVGCPWA